MELKSITAAYFSPVGSTRRVVVEIARIIAERAGTTFKILDLTLPEGRREKRVFSAGELLVAGTPVYAGRIPNKILPAFQELLEADGALAVPVVTFGNRSYDNALIEMRMELEKNGFHTIAAAAFVSEHVFSELLAKGRPDKDDMETVKRFAAGIFSKTEAIASGKNDGMAAIPAPIKVKGEDPIPGYYRPLTEDGKPALFLKAKPKTTDECSSCGKCSEICPMGSISAADCREVTGVCIKCQACVKACPVHAKYFDDPDMLSHIRYLIQHFRRDAENEVFL